MGEDVRSLLRSGDEQRMIQSHKAMFVSLPLMFSLNRGDFVQSPTSTEDGAASTSCESSMTLKEGKQRGSLGPCAATSIPPPFRPAVLGLEEGLAAFDPF